MFKHKRKLSPLEKEMPIALRKTISWTAYAMLACMVAGGLLFLLNIQTPYAAILLSIGGFLMVFVLVEILFSLVYVQMKRKRQGKKPLKIFYKLPKKEGQELSEQISSSGFGILASLSVFFVVALTFISLLVLYLVDPNQKHYPYAHSILFNGLILLSGAFMSAMSIYLLKLNIERQRHEKKAFMYLALLNSPNLMTTTRNYTAAHIVSITQFLFGMFLVVLAFKNLI